MPMNSVIFLHCSTLLPDAALLQGLEMGLQNFRIKVTPTRIASLHLFIQTVGRQGRVYIKELGPPSHENEM